jgi:GIY-YIG catalytic domain-containing protein
MSTLPPAVLDKIPHLPESPGVYLWKDADGTVLYVGKAKRLRSRVRSYANLERIESVKTYALMKAVAAMETIVVPSEAHALILEANLISARLRHPADRQRRVSLLRAVHRRRCDAARAQRREAHLHGAEL